jgi:hypothetical protein
MQELPVPTVSSVSAVAAVPPAIAYFPVVG